MVCVGVVLPQVLTSPVERQPYSAIAVNTPEVIDPSKNAILDVVIELFPRITSMVRDVTGNSTDLDVTTLFHSLIDVFLPSKRQFMESQAKQEQRKVNFTDPKLFDDLEGVLSIVSFMTESVVAQERLENNPLPDYTDLMPDLAIPEDKFQGMQIQEVKIPSRPVPVTSRPAITKTSTPYTMKTTTAATTTTKRSSTGNADSETPKSWWQSSPSAKHPTVFGRNDYVRPSATATKIGSHTSPTTDSAVSFYDLPNGGYAYTTHHIPR